MRVWDVTGVWLTPSKDGRDCDGDGTHLDKHGMPIECCCDECDYFLFCFADEPLFLS